MITYLAKLNPTLFLSGLLQNVRRVGANNSAQEAIAVWDAFNSYFSSAAGEVPWQYNVA